MEKWRVQISPSFWEEVEAWSFQFTDSAVLKFYTVDHELVKAYSPGSWLAMEPLKKKSAL
jgi:hypothetical protein